jgi:hypothetical protein
LESGAASARRYAANPGWFAPTDGAGGESFSTRTAQNDNPTHRSDVSSNAGDNWVRLRPGPKRIDELADFIEWMANAKPEDEQAIRAEIKRYFYDVGDPGSAAALNSHLTALLKPGITQGDRQRILDLMDVYTRADPVENVRNRDIATTLSLLLGSVPPVAPAISPTDPWKLGWAARPVFRGSTRPHVASEFPDHRQNSRRDRHQH